MKKAQKKWDLDNAFEDWESVAASMHPKEPNSENVRKMLAIITISILVLSAFFLYSNITGYSIANISYDNATLIGIVLFVIGLIGATVHFKKRK